MLDLRQELRGISAWAGWRACEPTIRDVDRPVVGPAQEADPPSWPTWQEVHRELRSNAARRSALDAHEARWLREAERVRIWKPLGMVSMLDYCERVLGYTPRAAADRLRVARSLEHLPVLTAAFAADELTFTAIRELVRVATPATERAWRDQAVGKNLRQIEDLVAGRSPGDRPEDPPDLAPRSHFVRYELSASTYALLCQAQQRINDDHGKHLDEDAFIAAVSNAVLDGGATSATAPIREHDGRARNQIIFAICPCCGRGSQQAGGRRIPVDARAIDRALCDAAYLGSVDGAGPARAYQDISPAVARFVWLRDQGRCQTEGCRSTIGLELHHLVHREDGGTHDPLNLSLRCSSCHTSHHDGTLRIPPTPRTSPAGTRPETVRVNDPARPIEVALAFDSARGTLIQDSAVAPGSVPVAGAADAERAVAAGTSFDLAVIRVQARDALTSLGWKPAIARAAVDEALTHVGQRPGLEALIREALRRCRRPASGAGSG